VARRRRQGEGRVSLLADILASKRREIEALRKSKLPAPSHTPVDVSAALRRSGALRLACEIKLKSPSAGPLSRALDVPSRAAIYAREGASLISVLCDGPFFDGGYEHLAAARAAVRTPLLAKEFVLDEVQIDAARAHGADTVLLIARIVDRPGLAALIAAARARGLEPIVEVVDEPELESALAGAARVIGVNARDLDTLQMDAARAARVLAAIPRDKVALHLSGVKTPDDVRAIAKGRADAALVGETLMRADDPAPILAELVRAAG
jgi:indole-3-glycerol phosphate synthase